METKGTTRKGNEPRPVEIGKYKMTFDYHTHTIFSHGEGTIEDNVKVAVSKGLGAIAITDHGPGHLTYGVKRSDFPVMREEINRLKPIYPEIEIYLGVEANVIHAGNFLDVTKEEYPLFDFVIAGYHYGIPKGYCVSNYIQKHLGLPDGMTRRLMVKNTEMTVRALHENNIKILTHPGDKGPFDIAEIARACEETDTLMELNMKHPFLTVEGIKIAAKADVKFIVSSDAHISQRVGNFGAALERAIEAGLDIERIVNIEKV
ncbi:MAG TPA: PHP domain-containing protein [Anaerovoracaceae bacterium]|nr:PHP domain-containing protein [Anaerovoracaceae bacterium]